MEHLPVPDCSAAKVRFRMQDSCVPIPDAQTGLTEIVSPSLSVNCGWTLVGNGVYAVSQWAMLVMLAKIATPDVVGRFALALAIATPLVMLTGLQLRGVQVTDARDTFCFQEYLGLRIIAVPIVILLMLGIILTGRYTGMTALVIFAVTLAKLLESIADIMHGAFQRYECLKRTAIALLFKGPLGLLGLTAGMLLTQDLRWAAFGIVMAWGLVLLCYEMPAVRRTLQGAGANPSLRPSFAPGTLCQLAWLALPLGLVMALNACNASAPRFFIEHFRGVRELGIFSAMSYLTIAGATVVFSLGQAFSPRMATSYAMGDMKLFRTLQWRLVAMATMLGGIGVLAAAVAGGPLLATIYRPEYARHLPVLLLLMVAAIPMYLASVFGIGMTAAHRYMPQLPLFLCVTVVLVAGCWWRIPHDGLLGAAEAMLMASLVQMFGSLLILRHVFTHNPVEGGAHGTV